MKKILIATPSLTQQVDAYYVYSVVESVKQGIKHNLDICPIFLANESILPMARNELLNLAYQEQYDQMVFIDADESWDKSALIEILLSEKDVITVPVVNKTEQKDRYNVWLDKNLEIDSSDGYIRVNRTGTGFLKLSKKVVTDLWNSNVELTFRNKTLKNICEYTYKNGEFIGEDIALSEKIKELGYTIWCNPKYTVSHIGTKMYRGDFKTYHKL